MSLISSSKNRVAHHFCITYKLGTAGYEKVLDTLERTYKVKTLFIGFYIMHYDLNRQKLAIRMRKM